MKKFKILKLIKKNIQNNLSKFLNQFDNDQNVLEQSKFFIRLITWGIIGTTGLTICWLALAKTEEIIVVKGKLEPIGDIKEIQLPIGGVIKDIYIENGQNIREGDILITLENDSSIQEVKSLEDQIKLAQKQLSLKKKELDFTINLINEQLLSTKEQLNIEEEILNSMKELINEGAISRIEYLTQISKTNSLKSDINTNKIDSNRKQSIINQQIEDYYSKISKLEAEATSAKVNLKYKSVYSPVSGQIFNLKAKSPGFVVKPSEPVMSIVPLKNLEAEVKIPSRKIGFVRLGMPSEINIDSYPANDFGTLKGTVTFIGSDVLLPEMIDTSKEYYYPALISLTSQQLKLKSGRELTLQTGMTLTANIKLRRVSYLQLIFSNFHDKANSLKEIK